jgi:aminoglycoside phosphotransferase (APT) family kinase protein
MKVAPQDSTRPVRAADSRRPAPDELRAALDQLLTRGARPRRITDVETRPLPYASSFAIEELDVRFDDGSRVDLVCKDTSDAAMLPEARRIKPGFLYNPLREIATYESILAPLGIGAPQFYGSVIDRRRGRYWLFLERVNGSPLTEIGDFDVWRQVSGWLARMHCRVAREPALARAAAAVPLMRYDGAHCRLWIERARAHLVHGALEPRSRRIRFAWLASRYEAVVEEIAALPTGFVHGEFFASNVLVDTAAGNVRVRPLDWELAGIGPALIDLAALTAGTWTDDERTELAVRYHAEVHPASEAWLPHDAFMRALDCCRVRLAVQHIGWAKPWTPPAAHTQDWLGEALEAAERIGL